MPKRHPMSFLPFSGGKRICLGKTFAEVMFKIVMTLILKEFNNKEGKLGEFVNKEHYFKKPFNNVGKPKRPEIFINVN